MKSALQEMLETSLSGKEKTTIRNMKITKGKTSLVKANTVKVVDQPFLKLVGELPWWRSG